MQGPLNAVFAAAHTRCENVKTIFLQHIRCTYANWHKTDNKHSVITFWGCAQSAQLSAWHEFAPNQCKLPQQRCCDFLARPHTRQTYTHTYPHANTHTHNTYITAPACGNVARAHMTPNVLTFSWRFSEIKYHCVNLIYVLFILAITKKKHKHYSLDFHLNTHKLLSSIVRK